MTHLRRVIQGGIAIVCVILAWALTATPAAADDCTTGITITSENTNSFENEGLLTFVFIADNVSSCDIEIPYSITDITTHPSDYGTPSPSSPLIIPAGNILALLNLPVVDDNIDEFDETLEIQIGAVVNATFSGAHPIGTIQDNDTASLSVNDITVIEGDSGTTNATFTLTLNRPTGFDVSVDVATASDTALAEDDFSTFATTVVFSAGETSKTVTIDVLADTTAEPHERFFLNLSGIAPANVVLADSQGIATLNNDDAPLSINDVSLTEGNSGATCATFTVSIPFPSALTASVNYATANLPDQADSSDYAATSGTLTFNAGQTSRNFCVDVAGDSVYEDDESFAVSLSSPTNATLTDPDGLGIILNDDAIPTLNIAPQSVTEGSGGINTFMLTATLTGLTENPVTVTVNTADDTADSDDYLGLTDATLTILPETLSGALPITIVTDYFDEPDETFTVTLTDPVNAIAGTLAAAVTIVDDDAPPVVSISDTACGETATACEFTISVDAPRPFPIAIDYVLSDGTATNGLDFNGAAGTFTLPADTTSGILGISVGAFDDNIYEGNETFTVTLQPASGISLGDAVGIGTIVDDEATPTLSIADVLNIVEGAASTTTNTNFTVTLSHPSAFTVTVNHSLTDDTATVADGDYVSPATDNDAAPTDGVLTFLPGQTTRIITVVVNGDNKREAIERFFVTLSAAGGASLADSNATGRILNDDPIPTVNLSATAVSCSEANADTTCILTVGLSNPSENTVTVTANTADGTATAGTDYTALSGHVISFPPNTTSATVSLTILGDTLYELNETFTLTLSSPTNANLGPSATATVTITNDDPLPVVSVSDQTFTEGSSGMGTITIDLAISGQSSQPIDLDYTLTPDTATEGDDYTGTGGSLTIPAFATSHSFTIPVNGDTTYETDESFTLTLDAATGAALGTASAVITLENDDLAPLVSAADVSCAEDAALCTITVTLDTASDVTATVDYTTSDGTATVNEDYPSTSGTLTFTAGQTSQTFTVDVATFDDAIYETDETVIITLSNPIDARLDDPATAVLTLLEDETPPTLSLVGDARLEPNSGTLAAIVTFTLSEPAAVPVTIDFTTEDDTALAGVDYVSRADQFIIPAGQVTATQPIDIIGDDFAEQTESFTVRVTAAQNATPDISNPVAIFITDDDPMRVSIADTVCPEGNPPDPSDCLVTVTVDAPALADIVLDYTLSDITTDAADYADASGTVTILQGSTSALLTIALTPDLDYEADETFIITLATPANALLSDGEALITLTNDDDAPVISIVNPANAATITEGDTGTAGDSLQLALNVTSYQPVVVSVNTLDGTATVADSDYQPVSTSVTIPAGSLTAALPFDVLGDEIYEPDETYSLALSDPQGATIGAGEEALGVTILNDDPLPTINLTETALTCPEGDVDSVCTLTIELSNPSSTPITVTADTADLTTSPNDYTALIGHIVTIPPHTLTTILEITITGDLTDEADESLTVTLSDATGGILGSADSATLTIADNDGLPTLFVTDQTLPEGSSGAGSLNVVISLTNPSAAPIDVSYTLTADTATEGDDYTGTGGTFTIPAEAPSYTLIIPVDGDTTYERDEAFILTIDSVTPVSLGAAVAAITIENDDPAPTVVAADLQCAENAVTCILTVTLDAASDIDAHVDYATSNGTATAGLDYAAQSGTLTFTAGQTSQTISLDVGTFDDAIFDADETFTVTFSNPIDALLPAAPTIITILENEPAPTLSLTGITVTEDQTDTVPATITFTLSEAVAVDVTIDFTTVDGTATAGSDYVTRTDQTVIPAGQTSITEVIDIITDILIEPTESFTVSVTNVVNAQLDGSNPATITILDDDVLRLSIADVTCAEGDAPDTPTCFFTVTGDAPAIEDVVITYTLADVSSEADDFDHTGGTVTLLEGQTTVTIGVVITGDDDYEFDDVFSLTLDAPVNATLTDDSALGTIANDDPFPTVLIDEPANTVSLTEGTGGQTLGEVNLTLSAFSELPTTVTFTTVDGTATAADPDYLPFSVEVTIPAGQLTATLPFEIVTDNKYEADQAFTIVQSTPVNATIIPSEEAATIIILNDDAQPTLTITGVDQAEGNSAPPHTTTAFVFSLSLSHPSEEPVTVDIATVNGTASAPLDFDALTEPLIFASEVTAQTLTVSVYADLIYENDESFQVALSNPVNATLGNTSATGVIRNDDTQPTLNLIPAALSEGNAGVADLMVTVALIGETEIPVTFGYATSDGSAKTSDGDYIATSGSHTLMAGETEYLLPISVNGDIKFERDEAFIVQFTSLTNADSTSPLASITLLNDDDAPAITAADATCAENAVSCAFVITIPTISGLDVRVDYATANGTATAGGDYTATSGTLIIPTGQTTATVHVPVGVWNNPQYEGDETFTLTLTNPIDATLARAVAVGTILEDEPAPTLTLTGATVTEGDSGLTSANVTFTLNTAIDAPVTIDFSTEDGTATAAADYVGRTGQVVIPAGQTSATATFDIITDTIAEPTESFAVRVTQAVNAQLNGSNPATITITDDDPMRLSIDDQTCAEGSVCLFTVTVDVPALTELNIPYTLADLTSESDDFDHTGGTATIAQGQTTTTISVTIYGDPDYEFDDVFRVVLDAPPNTVVVEDDEIGVGLILNDDPRPTLTATVTDVTQAEGSTGGVTPFVYPLTLSAKSDEVITLTVQVSDGTATAADGDYTAPPNTLTIAPGQTVYPLTVDVAADTKQESDEAFSITLSNPVNTTLTSGSESLTATILNDDGQPTISIADLSQAEESSATPAETTAFVFTVALSNPSTQPITVDVVSVASGEADSSDFIDLTPTTLTFEAGVSTQTVTVLVYADRTHENDETFTVQLSNPTNATLLDAVALGTIVNDDAVPSISVIGQSFAEGNSGASTVQLSVELTNPSENLISFTLDTADDSATAADPDYTPIVGANLSIPAGQTALDIPLSLIGDDKYEPDETFIVSLSNFSNVAEGTNNVLHTIQNDDAVPSLHIAPQTCAEADSTCDVVVFLSNPSYQPITATVNTLDGTATAPADYATITDGTVTVNAGATSANIVVSIADDGIYELDQHFTVSLSDAVNAGLGVASAAVTIADDDAAPTLSFQSTLYTLTEGDSGTSVLTFTLIQSDITEVDTTFNLALADGAAVQGVDFLALGSATGSIPAGQTSLSVPVTIVGDTDYETDEVFFLTVNTINNATPASLIGNGQINNDDQQPFIHAIGGSGVEGDAGQTSDCPVTLTLSNRSVETVRVTLVTQDATATSGGAFPDYTTLFHVVEFPPMSSAPIVVNVEILGDVLYEGATPEVINLVLGSQENARDVETGVTCAITDNETPPVASLTDGNALENLGAMPVNITLSHPSATPVTVYLTTADGTNDSPATAASNDYLPLSAEPVVIPAEATTAQGTVTVINDTIYEMDETFLITLTGADGATISPTGHTAEFVILNDESLPTLTLVPLASPVIEGTNTGDGRRAAYLAQLSIPSALPVTFDWEIFGGTASGSGPNADFSPANQTGLTFAPGVTTLVIGPTIVQDTTHELAETLSLRVVNVVGAIPSPAVPSGNITISDDDPVPSLSVNPVIAPEGDSGTNAVRFSLSNPTYQTVTFMAITAQGTATLADNDFIALTGFNPATGLPFEIPPLSTGLDVFILKGDTIVEADETFGITITAAGNAAVPVSAFTVTLQNDDAPPAIALGAASVTEGAPSTSATVTVPVTLNRPSDFVVTAEICTTDGTATAAANDYVQTCKPVSFPVRTTSANVSFTVNGDNVYEKLAGGTLDPHFVVSVTNPTNGIASPTNGSVNITIIDDDPIPTLTLTTLTASVTEGTGGTPNAAQFQVNLSNPTIHPVTVTYETFDVDTEGASDYTTATGATLNISARALTADFAVTITPDALDEPDTETFGVRITALTDAAATLPLSATVGILDDDAPPVISMTGETQPEGGTFTLTLTLSGASELPVSVTLNTADGTAVSGSDYLPLVNQVVSFPAGTTTQSQAVQTVQDTIREFDETFSVTMSAPVNATLSATPSVTLTILNEDNIVMVELVTNPSFEGKVITPWKLSKVYNKADKVICGTVAGPSTKSFDGLCSLQFTGNSTGPKAQLLGIFDRAVIDALLGDATNEIGTEDVLRLSFAYRAPNANSKPAVRVLAFTTSKIKTKLFEQNLPFNGDWSIYSVDVPLTTASFNSLRVFFLDKSVKGKWQLDRISILYIDNIPTFRSSDSAGLPLPMPPAPPDGFRIQP